MNFYNNLQTLCKSKGISVSHLLKKCGLSKSYGTNWENGTSPTLDVLITIAKELDLSIDSVAIGTSPELPQKYQSLINSYEQLSEYNKSMLEHIISSMINFQLEEERRSQIKVITIRLMRNKVSAGIGYDLNFNSDDDFKNIKVLDTPEAESADFAVTVEGESMSPDFHDGDIVLVKQQDNIDIGQIGIFTIDGDGYIKEYGKDCLISHNPKYPDIYPEEYQEVKCYGLVLGKTTIIE